MVLLLKLCLWSFLYLSSVHTTLQVLKVFFSSLNFCTILHWETTCDGQPSCRYEIQYKVYGDDKWQRITDCEKMKKLCNMTAKLLTKETFFEKIFARVRAKTKNNSSAWKISEFKALRETTISAPMLTVTASSNTILVYITAPLLLYHLKYAGIDYLEKMSFFIKMSASSQVILTENTEETKWNITNLPPGNYCISVSLKFGEITSSSSPDECVEIKGVIAKEVLIGSFVAVLASVVIVAILTIYLFLHRNVFYPKPPLPSNLILHNKKSRPNDNKFDVDFMIPSIFEGMELSKYIPPSVENASEDLQNKRYISTETWRKDYANCRLKHIDHNCLLDKKVELRNSTYDTKNICVNDCNVVITAQARYTGVEMLPCHTHFSNDKDYYNDIITNVTFCHKPVYSYVNQDDNLSNLHINDWEPLYNNNIDENS
ncbi:uncharacterized protein ACNLHF_013965 [Anomaloglossus baeobatrachus]